MFAYLQQPVHLTRKWTCGQAEQAAAVPKSNETPLLSFQSCFFPVMYGLLVNFKLFFCSVAHIYTAFKK